MKMMGMFCVWVAAFCCLTATVAAQDEVVASFQRTATPPVIDGLGNDAVWEQATVRTFDEFYELPGDDPNDGDDDMQITWQALWDADNLYLFVDIKDDEIVNEDSCNWQDDSVEFYIDAQNLDVDDYRPDANPGTPAFQLTAVAGDNAEAYCGELRIPEDSTSAFSWGINSYDGGDPFNPEDDELTAYPRGTDTSVAQIIDDNNWTFEVAFPWESLDETPENIIKNGEMGFGMAVNDDDIGGGRDSQWMWETDNGDLWRRSDVFPSVELVDDLAPGIEGDYNANGALDSGDLDLNASVGIANRDLSYDLNEDGVVNTADRIAWVNGLKNTWMGDADLNGVFDSSDLVKVFSAAKYESGQAATWDQGDWDGDMTFNSGDLVAAFSNAGYDAGERPGGPNPAVVVPEPTSMVLILFGCLCFLARRK